MWNSGFCQIICLIISVGLFVTTRGQGGSLQARLVGGHSNGTGLVQLFVNGEWVSVYNSYFHYNEAKVLCRMLGYNNSLVKEFQTGQSLFGSVSGSVLVHTFGCHGDEADLKQCGSSSSWSVSGTQSHSHDVGVSCENTQLRLVDGDDAHSGRVELFFNGGWHSICDNYFDDKAAHVVCNSLGFSNTGVARAYSGSHFGQGYGDAIITSLQCTGSESDIKLCSGTWKPSACDHRHDTGVNCGGTRIRLVNGPTNTSGRVEVYHGGKWGTICGNNNFDSRSAQVICRMLGINTTKAIAYPEAYYGEGFSQIIVSGLACDGSEPDIAACGSAAWALSGTPSYCTHEKDVGVNCAGVTQIRLVDGVSEQSGRVEVLHNGHWGTISDNYFDDHDLKVICNMMGYEYSSRSFFVKGSYYGQGMGEVVMDRLQCNGDESDIGFCSATRWPDTRRNDHNHDVGVNCDGVIPIRLVGGGNSSSSGRVEVLHNGVYGTVCSRGFDRLDLIVVCRMLGYENIPRSAYWRPAAKHAQGLGETVYPNLGCNGIEDNIGKCSHDWPVNYCDHGDDVYVNCQGDQETLRLVDGKTQFSGRVEILHDGRWGTICNTHFDRADAVVICRILNYQNPENAVAFTNAHFGRANDTVSISLGNLQCNGLETNLGQCNPTWDQDISYCSHASDASVDCCPNCHAQAIIG